MTNSKKDIPRKLPEIKLQLNQVRAIMQDWDKSIHIAKNLHDEHYSRQGLEVTPFHYEPIEKEVYENVAMCTAPMVAMEAVLSYLVESKKQDPMRTIWTLQKGTLDDASLLLAARLANLTWKVGQPFRSPDRIQRDCFIPAAQLSQEELLKDYDQLQAAATVFELNLERGVEPTESYDKQVNYMTKLMQGFDFMTDAARHIHYAYFKDTGQKPFEFDPGPVRKEVYEQISKNLSGFYATECFIGYLCEQNILTPKEALGKIINKKLTDHEEKLAARFSKTAYKAAQLFINKDNIKKSGFIPAFLDTEYNYKLDLIQIEIGANLLLKHLNGEPIKQ